MELSANAILLGRSTAAVAILVDELSIDPQLGAIIKRESTFLTSEDIAWRRLNITASNVGRAA